jgi:uncharacterized protein YndB with AHSA1/START domain
MASKAIFEVDKDKLEVRITKEFDATPERMWQAFTTPEEIAKWWDKTTIDQHDFRVGGKWRFVSKDDHDPSKEHAFNGEFKEIDEPNKIVRTFEYEPWAGHILVETVTFEPVDGGKTKMLTVSKYASLQDLEGMVQSGMERGAVAGLDRLAKVVEDKE